MTSFNILEKLNEKFQELKLDISKNDEILETLNAKKNKCDIELMKLNEELNGIHNEIQFYVEKKERLNMILQTTQENFETSCFTS